MNKSTYHVQMDRHKEGFHALVEYVQIKIPISVMDPGLAFWDEALPFIVDIKMVQP